MHIQQYLDIGAKNHRGTRSNRERSCLSSCLSWLIRNGKVPNLIVNPCLRDSGIQRNPEKARDRYVTHDEYKDVLAVAPPQVKSMMELIYMTLQRPESDMLDLTILNIVTKNGQRILKIAQRKTGAIVDIAMSEDLDTLLTKLIGEVPAIGRPLIHAVRGKFANQRYTYGGISSMLKRSIKKANTIRVEKGNTELIPSFGFRDIKGKGATDMWLASAAQQFSALPPAGTRLPYQL